jgi:hypothetical protein
MITSKDQQVAPNGASPFDQIPTASSLMHSWSTDIIRISEFYGSPFLFLFPLISFCVWVGGKGLRSAAYGMVCLFLFIRNGIEGEAR